MEELVRLTIDGREVQVPKGTTVLKAAEKLGIEIPRLCFLEGLAPGGACRLCLVELNGGKLVPSCTQRVQEGMEVRTDSPRVQEARRFVLELMWSIHPGDCATCEKAGACELQKYTYQLGLKVRPPVELPEEPPWDRESPLIERDLRLCILCGRCIAACRELSQGILDYMRRGMLTLVTTPFNKRLDEAGCDFCGSCIAVCPVGCLVERDRKFRGREWELSPVTTACGLCSAGCQVLLDLGKGEPVRARPGADGFLCARGKFGWDFLGDGERLTVPLIRDGDGFKEAGWEEALGLVAERLSRLREQAGPEALGGIAGAWLPSEALYAFQRLLRDSLGSGNLGAWGLELSAEEALALPGRLLSLPELEEAGAILAAGPALGESYPRLRVAIKRALKRKARLVVVDPLDSELAKLAAVHLKPRPGRELAVLSALGEVLSGEEPEDVEVPLDLLKGAAEVLSGGFVGAASLEFLTAVLRVGAQGAVGLSPYGNWWGAVASGLHPELLPGPRPVEGAAPSGLGPKDLLAPGSPVKGLLVVGADPVGEGTELPELEFLVVQDLFLTETAERADVVLPLRGPFEEPGTLLVPQPKPLPGLERTEIPAAWEIFLRLSQLLGHPWEADSLEGLWRKLSENLVSEPQGELPAPLPVEPGEGKVAIRVYPRFALPRRTWTVRSKLGELSPTWDSVGLPPDELAALGLSPGDRVEVRWASGGLTGRAWEWEALPVGAVALPYQGGAGREGFVEVSRAEEVA
ncbi:molybdopterin-dependent oxidoreductase [Candidatus Bipolaricaulota sp. J31]